MNVINIERIKLSMWFRSNKLSLNASKTNFILFGNKRMQNNIELKLILDENVLERVDSTKFLGVYLDNKLNWSYHLDYIASKISKGLGMMSRCRKILSNDVLLLLYYSLIYPYLIYCSIVWGGACLSALHKIEVLQNRAVRLITYSPFRSSPGPLYKALHLLKFVDIYKIQVMMFMYKCKNSLLPDACMHYCLINSDHFYNMRNNHDFATISYRTNVREQCIRVVGPRLWNMLPSEMRLSENVNILKSATRNYLISLY